MFKVQAIGVCATAAFAGIGTLVLLKIVDAVVGLRVSTDEEREGLDIVLHGEQAWRLTPPRFEEGFREGCGDAMMGALAAAWARGESFERAVVLGAAAGAAAALAGSRAS